MWRCVQCAEELDNNFDTCWNCGCSADGTPNPYFRSEVSEPLTASINVRAFNAPFTQGELGAFVCRALVLWLVFGSFQIVVALVLSVFTTDFPASNALELGTFFGLGQFVGAGLLWVYSVPIGRRLVTRPDAPLHVIRVNVESLLSLVFIGIGAFYAVGQIRIVASLLQVAVVARQGFFDSSTFESIHRTLWPSVAAFSTSLWLVFDARRIAKKIAPYPLSITRRVRDQREHVASSAADAEKL